MLNQSLTNLLIANGITNRPRRFSANSRHDSCEMICKSQQSVGSVC